MIIPIKFREIIDDLEAMFTPLTDKKRDFYFEYLKGYPEEYLEKAVKHLIEIHPFQRIPNIREIKEAILEVRADVGYALPEDLDNPFKEDLACRDCDGGGLVLVSYKWFGMEYTKAVPCSCEEGRKRRRGWAIYFSKKKK